MLQVQEKPNLQCDTRDVSYKYIYILTHTYKYVYIYRYMCLHTYVYIYICTNTCACVFVRHILVRSFHPMSPPKYSPKLHVPPNAEHVSQVTRNSRSVATFPETLLKGRMGNRVCGSEPLHSAALDSQDHTRSHSLRHPRHCTMENKPKRV